jgi:hypothetical protein
MPESIRSVMMGGHEYILWMGLFAFGAHMVEAFFMDFVTWAKKTLHVNVTAAHFFTVQGFGLMTAIATAMVGWDAPSFSLLFPAALILAALVHIVLSMKCGCIMPGLLTAVVLFLPIGIAAYMGASWDGVLTTRTGLLSGLWAILLMAFPFTLIRCCCCKK